MQTVKAGGRNGLRNRKLLTAVSLGSLLAAAAPALAQDALPPSAPGQQRGTAPEAEFGPRAQSEAVGSEIVVLGSRIAGAKITEALPVSVVSSTDIAATAAVSGDELFRSIPQMGASVFNTTNGQGSSNFARGDVGSVNLRNLGIGNTLVLLNGRRVVGHPSSQANADLVPVLTYNTNAIPTAGVQRLEVLRDGAAALYGTDAVAGVVNTVLRDNVNGASVDLQYGGAEGTGMREFSLNGYAGTNFQENRGNVTLFFSYNHRTPLSTTDQDFTSSGDRRGDFIGTAFEGLNTLDRRSTLGAWADMAAIGFTGAIRQGTTPLTTAGGVFSIRPTANGNCRYQFAGGFCIRDGTRATSGADRNTRTDTQQFQPLSISPRLNRINLYSTAHYDLNDNITLFGELGYYYAKTRSIQDSVFSIGSIPMNIPASNYWNPFGPVTFANGTRNPNRLANLNIPAAGLPVRLTNYRFLDMGPTTVEVATQQFRAVAGLRGDALGFRWESALVYSRATVDDQQDGISASKLQANLALSTPDAYNPFNGGDINQPTGPDGTPSSQASLDAIHIITQRKGATTLAQWDFRASKSDLFALPAGDAGVAFGTEVRRDTQLDDRDPRVDGTITWTDVVTGVVQPSDLYGVSPTPDTRGARTVAAAYIEFALPLISPEMGIPLVRSLDVQLAGRYEHYSDFGSIAKPKVAAAWDVIEGLRLRGSWAQGFRAPNLEQTNATIITRGNTRVDYLRCEADLRAGRITKFSDCSASYVVTAQRAGNPDLKPETSTTWSVGAVLQPAFANNGQFRTTFTVDYWNVKQKGIVGLFGEGNAVILDYLLRTEGKTNPDVMRLPASADDIIRFAGTGLEPAGQVQYVKDLYQNLNPQTVRGLDMALNFAVYDTGIGDFSLRIDAARLIEFYRAPPPGIQTLIDARAAGKINAGTAIPEGGSLLGFDPLPKWRGSATLIWTLDNVQIGLFSQYAGSLYDNSLRNNEGDFWLVKSQVSANIYGQYTFKDGFLDRTRVRLGVRNFTNARPPIATGSAFGYLGTLYLPYRRYWYVNINKEF